MDPSTELLDQNRLLGELIDGADPATPVPTCPGWTLQQLLRHVGRGDRWAAQIVGDRMDSALDPREVRGGKPPADPAGTLEWLRGSPAALIDAVAATGPDTPVWTFLGPRPAGWWLRRRLHETVVHRADAAIALGVPYELPAALAADAVSEAIELFAGRGSAAPPALDPGVTLHLHATDGADGGGLGAAGEWLIRGTDSGVTWEHGHGKGDAAVRGRAVDLLLTGMRRAEAADRGVEVLGDPTVWTTWLARTVF